MRAWIWGAAALAYAGAAQAGSTVTYAPTPGWVGPPPAATTTAPPAGAAVQVIYTDNQARLGATTDELHTSYRLKILSPQALPLGNISAVWQPDTDDFVVHAVKIHRDGKVIDVLSQTKFAVVQRENNLEQSILDGQLTANLQPPGLQVGDELEFSGTVRRSDPLLAGRSQGGLQLTGVGGPGAHRVRLAWPRAETLHWRATPDLGQLKPVEEGQTYVVTYEMRDPKSAIETDGAPPRFNIRRLLQYSSFSSWAEVAGLASPLFENAARLAPNSPIKAEAAKIAAATKDPGQRAVAALALVQDRIRYVYVGLEGGNYRPATADETWERRFGDCKGKTVVLLALLRELGVPAEAVLVDAEGGDGLNEQLPWLGAFNHVLVRAVIDGQAHWLDGTRLGDRHLELIPPPVFRWGLPLKASGAELIAVEPTAPLLVDQGTVMEVDASKGFETPAIFTVERVIRGDDAFILKTALSQLSAEDAERALKEYWVDQFAWIEPKTVSWRYQEDRAAIVLNLAGEGEPEWEGDERRGHVLDVYAAGFYPPPEYRRPREQDKKAPWVLDFPSFARSTTIIRLPPEREGWKWDYQASEMDEKIGGVVYWRSAELHDRVLRTTRSRRTLKPEITAAEAEAATKSIPNFDNNISRVFEYREEARPGAAEIQAAMDEYAGSDLAKLVGLGSYLASDGDLDGAMRAYDKALKLDPDNTAVLRAKASILTEQGRHADALKLLDRALKKKADPEIALARGAALIRLGKVDEGMAIMEAVLAANPGNTAVLASFADEAWRARKEERALAAASEALKKDPDDLQLLQIRAAALSRAGRWAEALPDLEAALRLQPESSVNFRNRAMAYRSLGRLDEAIADMEEALRIDPLSTANMTAQARNFRLAKRPAEGVALFDLAVARARTANTLNNRCWERALANLQLDEAERDCAEAVRLEPDASGYWDSYGLVAFRKGRLDEAMRHYDRAIKLQPKQANSFYVRGLIKLRKGDVAGGQADIAAAKALSPKVDETYNEIGVTP